MVVSALPALKMVILPPLSVVKTALPPNSAPRPKKPLLFTVVEIAVPPDATYKMPLELIVVETAEPPV